MQMRTIITLCLILLSTPGLAADGTTPTPAAVIAGAVAADAPQKFDDVPTANHTYAGVAISDTDAPAAPSDDNATAAAPGTTTPLVSVNTNGLDLSWTGAMDLADPMLRPSGIVLPFLENYPIDTVEIKMRLLNLKF